VAENRKFLEVGGRAFRVAGKIGLFRNWLFPWMPIASRWVNDASGLAALRQVDPRSCSGNSMTLHPAGKQYNIVQSYIIWT
jgi:hypothetical protein